MEPLGHTLGPYQILEKIGQGGMAEVYKGFHPALHRYVAIKLLGQFLQADPSFARRFQREAQAVAALRHPNIIQIFDFGTQNDSHYLVMEYVEGKDLGDEIEQRHAAGKPFTPNEILQLLSQVADALDYAHQQGVIHRDIKPGNILLTEDGRAILTDFGLAMLRDRVSPATMGRSFGTPEYIAPEQAIDSRAAVPQSDIYALGVILYEMVTGHLPFEDESPLSLALKHINEEPTPPRHYVPQLPEAVEAVILRALAKEPAERFPTTRAMVKALRQAWSGAGVRLSEELSPSVVSPGGPQHPRSSSPANGERVSSSIWRRRGLLIAGSLGLILVGLLGFFTFIQDSGPLAIAGATPTATPTPTSTPVPTEPPAPTVTATVSPTYTATSTPSPTNTFTPTPTSPATATPVPTATATPSPIPTDTPTPTPAPTDTPASTPVEPADLYNRILFKTDRSGSVEIYSMNPDGSDARLVPNPVIYNELAASEALSPDRKQQIVVRTEGNAELWLVTLDGSRDEWRITYAAQNDYDPAWSPAGDLIAFVSEQSGNSDIYISTPLGFDMRRITFNESPLDRHPTWSPDGRYLAFWSDARYDLRQIYVYDLWGGETQLVGGGPFNDWDPLWGK
jgi:serine/threonine protein kinase